jgi:hypothetical protein
MTVAMTRLPDCSNRFASASKQNVLVKVDRSAPSNERVAYPWTGRFGLLRPYHKKILRETLFDREISPVLYPRA